MKAIALSKCGIEASNEVKYLGIALYSKLSFKTHVDNKIDKCTRALFTCRNIAGKSWGTSPRIIRWLYLMVVRPILTYGAKPRVIEHALAPLRRNSISFRVRTCPTVALEVLVEVTPLHIVTEMKRKATLIRIEGAGNDCNLTSKDAESLKRDIP